MITIVTKVKRHLWTHGVKAKDCSGFSPFDILIENKDKMKVKTSRPYYNRKDKTFWKITELKIDEFDILAFIVQPIETPFYISKKDLLRKITPFRIKQNKGVYEITITKNVLYSNFVKDPKKIKVGK